MTNLLQKINLKGLGILSFLVFFIFTPLFPKVQVGEGIFVEPLLPFLVFGLVSIVAGLWIKNGREKFTAVLKDFLIPNKIALFYYFLMAVLFVSYFYGLVLTGVPSSDDFLHLFKFTLYFLPFPLALYFGRLGGNNLIRRVLQIVILVGVIAALVSLFRIWEFTKSGGSIDFWVYDIRNRSVGFLSQFIDLKNWTIEFTGKAAHATFGLYVSVVLAVCLALITTVRRFSARWFDYFFASAIIFYSGILYTLSRGAIVTGIGVFTAWFVWLLKEKRIKTVAFFSGTLVVVSLILIQLNPQVYSKFFSTISIQDDAVKPDSTTVTVDASTLGRFERWGKIFDLFKEKPYFAVFGVGYNQHNLDKFTGVSLTHSLFLDLWVRGGLAALGLVIAIWGLLFKKIFDFLRSRGKEIQVFGFVLGGFLAGWLLDNLISGEQFFSDAPMIAFWGVLGLITALSELKSKKDKVKVLIALTSMQVGGAPQVVFDLLSNLSKSKSRDGEKFEFVVAGPSGVFLQKFRKIGYKVYSVRLDKISLRSFKNFLEVARKEQVDLINSHGKGAGLYARKVGFILDVPVVHTIHGIHYSKTNPISRNFYFLSERILSLFTKLVISVSKSQEREGLSLKLFPKNKSRVVFNGVDTENWKLETGNRKLIRKSLGLAPNHFAVTMVARFDPPGIKHKGHERFVNLLPALIREIPNLKIVFVGGPSTSSGRVKKLARELGVSENTIFLGERNDVPKILAASDALVLPSYHEGLPLAPLEAAAVGLPVVGSNVVGVKDTVLDGKTGYLVDFDKQAEVTKAFRQLAKSPVIRRKMGENGRRFVAQNFGIDKFVNSTLKIYQQALVE
ncbi:MAG: glycosyltransferase [Parcubacteria group bacterium]